MIFNITPYHLVGDAGLMGGGEPSRIETLGKKRKKRKTKAKPKKRKTTRAKKKK